MVQFIKTVTSVLNKLNYIYIIQEIQKYFSQLQGLDGQGHKILTEIVLKLIKGKITKEMLQIKNKYKYSYLTAQ